MHANWLRQRSDLTHKHNRKSGRHGWLRLTPAYSVKLVGHVLGHYHEAIRVLDPFCGTGTTVLAAAERGHTAQGVDINPFLVWLASAKIARYTTADRQEAHRAIEEAARLRTHRPAAPPPMHNMDRWWHPKTLAALCDIKGRLDALAARPGKVRDLLNIAFCQTLIELSNAAFNHQSMSFAGERADREHSLKHCLDRFARNAVAVLDALSPNPAGSAVISMGDSRGPPPDGQYDLVLTSPPYPNRMSYIRELRPYMYWLGLLKEAKEAGEMDWQAIGGTWGAATSRLADWTAQPGTPLPGPFPRALAQIERANTVNGPLLARYVHRYCGDIWQHIQAVTRALPPGAKVVYVVGNSTFYGIMVPTERMYAEFLKMAGFVNVHIEPFRKRTSKRELFEYAIEADYAAPGEVGRVAALSRPPAATLF